MPIRHPFVRIATPDGSDIAVHDLGGEGAPLLLAHATGFHAMVLAELARHLGSFQCYGLDLPGPRLLAARQAVVGRGMGRFRQRRPHRGRRLGLEQPYAFGHSCGGASVLLAEEAAPGTFRHLYCYEPIVPPELEPCGAISPMRSRSGRLAGAGVLPRRTRPLPTTPPSRRVRHQLLVLRDYVDHGFETEPDGSVRLRCRPADEARVFANAIGHDAFGCLPKVDLPG